MTARRRASGWIWALWLLLLAFLWWLAGFLQLRKFLRFEGRGDDAGPSQQGAREPDCLPIPTDVYRRPDPMIYSQTYLMSQGLSVTWDNPDIHLELGGVPVGPSDLVVNTEYDIVARIWNGSNNAPAVNLPVRFSYLDFGIGTANVPIGFDKVDLPVNGAVGHPAIAHRKWKTPKTAGHYCIQVEPVWPDDANPANNLGQENTNVKALNSPHAAFTFPVRNDGRLERTLALEIDGYTVHDPGSCEDPRPAATAAMNDDEKEQHRQAAVVRHGRGRHPLPDGWRVTVDPPELRIEPGKSGDVTVDVTAPDGFLGRQGINVNAFAGDRLVGGVTLYVDGSGS